MDFPLCSYMFARIVSPKTHLDVAREDIGGEQLLGHVRQISPNARDGKHRRTLSRIFPPPKRSDIRTLRNFYSRVRRKFCILSNADSDISLYTVDRCISHSHGIRALVSLYRCVYIVFTCTYICSMYASVYVLSNIPIYNVWFVRLLSKINFFHWLIL